MAKQFEPPTHAYVPGVSKRHAEGHFDHIRSSIKAGMTPEELKESDAFQCGLRFLETGFFWEAHEVLEPVWQVLPAESDERIFVQALIQFANARLKILMQRPEAAKRLCVIVRDLLSQVESEVVFGLEISGVIDRVDKLESQLPNQ